jgi:hypothetical protein
MTSTLVAEAITPIAIEFSVHVPGERVNKVPALSWKLLQVKGWVSKSAFKSYVWRVFWLGSPNTVYEALPGDTDRIYFGTEY